MMDSLIRQAPKGRAMRLRTVAVLGGLLLFLGALVIYGLGAGVSGGTLTETWVSETPRDNVRNHHAVGVGPHGEVIVAPLAEVPGGDVEMTDTSCALVRLTPENGSVVWREGMPAADCFTHALTEPAIADIDGDGSMEIVVATTENALVVYGADHGREEFRVPLTTFGYGRPAIADIRPAPGKELVTSDIDGHVVVASANGTTLWQTPLNVTLAENSGVWEAPIVEDVDADGTEEVLIGANGGLALFDARGRVEWSRDDPATYVTTAQADDDPAIEVFASNYRSLRAYDGATGEREWTRNINVRLHDATDTDGDGTAELFVSRSDGTVLALDAASGEPEWSTTVAPDENTLVPAPALGDVDGDGREEVIAVTNAGVVSVLNADSGAVLASYEREVPIWTFVTPADIDDDGRDEILVRYGDGRVVALDYAS